MTKVKIDTIVNAANTFLLGGVDGAIHRIGRSETLVVYRNIITKQREFKPREVVLTTAGNLSANYVIHAVGSIWSQGVKAKEELLCVCYVNLLQ